MFSAFVFIVAGWWFFVCFFKFTVFVAALVVFLWILEHSLKLTTAQITAIILTPYSVSTRDNWQEMVTEEIKTHFRKANRQVDKKL